jgi:hypothetical protein
MQNPRNAALRFQRNENDFDESLFLLFYYSQRKLLEDYLDDFT